MDQDGKVEFNMSTQSSPYSEPRAALLTRTEAQAVINTERDYQDSKWPEDGKSKPHMSPSEFLRLIEKIATDADGPWYTSADPVVNGARCCPSDMVALRKIAACAQRAIELYGAPLRPPVPTSN